MSALEQRLADYLGLRRALGYRLVEHGRDLADFVAFLDERGQDTVTVTAALAWASASGASVPPTCCAQDPRAPPRTCTHPRRWPR